MKKLKPKSFFIKSFFLMFFITIMTTIISLGFFEPQAYNFMTKYFTAGSKQASENTVIIVIDDKSISYHRWPWPREYYGKIIDYLTEYSNPQVIGFDAIIPGLDKDNPKSDAKFFKSVGNADKLVVGFSALMNDQYDINRTNAYNQKFKNKFQTINIKNETPSFYNVTKYIGLSEYPEEYFNVAKKVGSVNVTPNDLDGFVTKMDQVISVSGEFYPSLALQMYMHANNINTLTLQTDKIIVGEGQVTIPAAYTVNGVQNFIRFYKKTSSDYTHQKYSASDIIRSYDNIKQGKKPIIDPKEFDGKVVFIGANAKAAALSLEDALPTPLNEKHPGTDIQATNYDNIVNNEFVKTSSTGNILLIIALMAMITFTIICKFPFAVSLTTNIIISIAYFIYAIICYKNGYAVSLATPIAIQIATSVFGYSYRFIQEGRNKEKIKQAMGKYLSQDIMQNVVKNIDDIKLGGKRANVTVLFADIRGFTSMSEKMTAEEVSKILNEYFTEIEPIITQYNGVINKFIGDAVMAIFGEPIQDINHPVNAVKCAYAMLKKVEDLQEKWLFEGKPKIEIGVGINTGDAFVGNIGSEKRLEYTVIGDTVNLASRIEGYNKVYHTNLLVSSSTYSYIRDIADVIKISDVQIRGKAKKMDIYEVLRINQKH